MSTKIAKLIEDHTPTALAVVFGAGCTTAYACVSVFLLEPCRGEVHDLRPLKDKLQKEIRRADSFSAQLATYDQKKAQEILALKEALLKARTESEQQLLGLEKTSREDRTKP